MKTQTDKKIADELQRTYEAQREAQVKRQDLERETAIANMQGEVVRSEQMVRITEKNALAVAEAARGEGNARRARAEAEAAAVRVKGEAEGDAIRAIGAAKAEAYRQGQDSLGSAAYTSLQLAGILGENSVKLVPDISVGGGEGSSRLADVLIGRMLLGAPPSGGTPPSGGAA